MWRKSSKCTRVLHDKCTLILTSDVYECSLAGLNDSFTTLLSFVAKEIE